jgi:hypothetical protein
VQLHGGSLGHVASAYVCYYLFPFIRVVIYTERIIATLSGQKCAAHHAVGHGAADDSLMINAVPCQIYSHKHTLCVRAERPSNDNGASERVRCYFAVSPAAAVTLAARAVA